LKTVQLRCQKAVFFVARTRKNEANKQPGGRNIAAIMLFV
jgi:hypothetical protein